MTMRFLQYTLPAVLFGLFAHAQQTAPKESGSLRIVVLDGDGATNFLDSKAAVNPSVEVRDANDAPVAGARVTFLLPQSGAGAVFPGDRCAIRLITGPDGQAKTPDMRPIGTGRFEIEIRVESMGQTASVTIAQTNLAARSEAGGGSTESPGFRIEILEGDDGVNIIDKKTAVKSVVRVVDKNNLPVAGVGVAVAVVAMRGAKAEFPGGKSTLSVTTGSDGRAEVPAVRPSGEGTFQIRAQVNANGQVATQTLTQTNYSTEFAALSAGKFPGMSKSDGGGAGRSGDAAARVRVLGDETGKNVVKGSKGTTPAVQVTDAAGTPLGGVRVAFIVESPGKLAQFANGDRYLIMMTDSDGRAVALQLKPLGKGTFSVRVLVAYNGEVVTGIIPQVNYSTLAAMQKDQKGLRKSGSNTSKTATAAQGGSKLMPILLVTAGALGAAGAVCQATESKCGAANGTSTSTSNNCSDSALNQFLSKFISDLNLVVSSCPGSSGQCVNAQGACRTNCQTLLNGLDQFCQCGGAQYISPYVARFLSLGFSLPSSCR